MYLEKQGAAPSYRQWARWICGPERESPVDGVRHDPGEKAGERHIARKQAVAACGHDSHILTMIRHPGYGPSGSQSAAGRRGCLKAAGGKSRGAVPPAAARWSFNI